ncbi:magnesium transporter [Thalassotalea mangrovi]|uniref:Magnesium transporter n=1 Tax=Thalassotalea mangrovi TaxID=2572245 RepID=A0A4U1BAP4_9GAMM|nr:magnesium transporter [Thalassotalea mangrovi]TKB47485.1 magnesium transporter [Thalassotalea mangrovi]
MNENSLVNVNINQLIETLAQPDFALPDEYGSLNALQWATIFESLLNSQRLALWPHIPSELSSSILSEMREDARGHFLSELPQANIEEAVFSGTNAEVVEILDALPQKTVVRLVNKLAPGTQSQIETSLSYSDEQVGRYADQEVYTIASTALVRDVLREVKSAEHLHEGNSYVVTDASAKYLGEVNINDLLNASAKQSIAELVHLPETQIDAEQSLLDASNLVRGSQKAALPVVDGHGRFIGQFSIQDALSVFQEYYESQMAHLGQVSDEDLFAPVVLSAKRRAIWLGINLLTAFLASFVIGIFDAVLVEVVALAVLMPIVASMGGITGSQTLTLSIRGLATGQLNSVNYQYLRRKEFLVAALNGAFWAVMVGILAYFWFSDVFVSVILASALLINMLVASLSGMAVPKVLDKLGVDPAIAGSVILTTITDVVGFFVFLGSATIIFLR